MSNHTTRAAIGYHVAALIVSLLLPGGALPAQELMRRGPRLPVAVAVSESFGYRDADAVIVRRARAEPHDVLLIRSGRADAATIAYGLGMVQAVRKRFGEVPTADALIRVRAPKTHKGRLRFAEHGRQWAKELGAVEKSELEAIGSVRRIDVALPALP
jgi:hypothetical protein